MYVSSTHDSLKYGFSWWAQRVLVAHWWHACHQHMLGQPGHSVDRTQCWGVTKDCMEPERSWYASKYCAVAGMPVEHVCKMCTYTSQLIIQVHPYYNKLPCNVKATVITLLPVLSTVLRISMHPCMVPIMGNAIIQPQTWMKIALWFCTSAKPQS